MRRVFFIALLFLAPVFAFADLIPAYNTTLNLTMTPQYPRPGDIVTITATNPGGGTDIATYIWSVNNTVVLQGIGKKTLTLAAGALGQAEIVTVVTTQNGTPEAAAQALIEPADVDLVWEGNTAVPPFYIGRPLPNAGSAVMVFAVPHLVSNGKELPGEVLVYKWSEDGAPLADQSGYGKSSVVVTPPRFGQAFTVSVRAQTFDGLSAADGATIIQPQNPSALIYENDPLIGIRFDKNVSGAFPLPETEVSFTAFPLFVSNPNALSYRWSLDGKTFTVDPKHPRDVTFRKTTSGSGSNAVLFSFSNPNSFIEHAEHPFTLTF